MWRNDQRQNSTASSWRTNGKSPNAPWKGQPNAWLWKNVERTRVVRVIEPATLKPSSTPVSNAVPADLVCSYSWLDGPGSDYEVPGYAPEWQPPTLPITLKPDVGQVFIDQNAYRLPKLSFDPLFKSARQMNPEFTFDNIDIVVNRNSLRKLLDVCSDAKQWPYRLNLFLINKTLIIERCEKLTAEHVKGSAGRYGFGFENLCTKTLPDSEKTSGHHRALSYMLGGLRCVVRFETDASYNGTAENKSGDNDPGSTLDDSLATDLGKMAISTAAGDERPVMPQSTAAELKTTRKNKSTSLYLPQLWFGRTPWLMVGRQENGQFDSIKVTHAATLFDEWVERKQVELQKVVTVLQELREAVKEMDCKDCVAIWESKPDKAIRVYPASSERLPISLDLVRRCWTSRAGKL